MDDPVVTKAIADNVFVIYALVFYAVVSTLAKTVPFLAKMMGPLGKWMRRNTDRARSAEIRHFEALQAQLREHQAAAEEREKALSEQHTREIEQLRAELRVEVAKRVAQRQEQHERNVQHTQWDLAMLRAVERAQIDVSDVGNPPTLY